jgi:hypothetical protein
MANQRTFWSAIVTMVMWVALTVISIIFMFLDDVSSAGAAMFIIIMAGMALGGTIAIWETTSQGQESTQDDSGASRAAASSQRKSKRAVSPDLARLVDQLDQDQIIELETLLLSRDDEFAEYE